MMLKVYDKSSSFSKEQKSFEPELFFVLKQQAVEELFKNIEAPKK